MSVMIQNGKIKILVVDDHAIVRQGLHQIVAEADGMYVGGEASNGQELLARLRGEHWDVVVLDISLPDRSGLDLLKHIHNFHPRLPVLVLTMHAEEQYAIRVLRAGAAGFLTKESAPDELVNAIRKVGSGGRYVGPSLAEKLVTSILNEKDASIPPHRRLTDREFEVFRMITSGHRLKHIAEKLCVSVKTISSHRARILSKMSMRTNAELIQYALENKLIA